jgi:hypothetical protein
MPNLIPPILSWGIVTRSKVRQIESIRPGSPILAVILVLPDSLKNCACSHVSGPIEDRFGCKLLKRSALQGTSPLPLS